MLDWRILGASFAALIIISAVFLGGTGTSDETPTSEGGIGDMLSGVFDKISSWFSGSPFGGFFEQPVARSSTVQLILYPDEFSLTPESEISLSSGETMIKGFSGQMDANFVNQTMTLSEKGSSMTVTLPLQSIILDEIRITSLNLDGMKFEIVPNMTANNGTLEMSNFLGRMEFNEDRIDLFGNVSRLRARIGTMKWELV
jgi:hypothetical protein